MIVLSEKKYTPVRPGLFVGCVWQVNKSLAAYNAAMAALELRCGLKIVMALSSLGNAYLQNTKPWVSFKEGDLDRSATIVTHAAELVRLLVSLAEPFMPGFSEKVGGKFVRCAWWFL